MKPDNQIAGQVEEETVARPAAGCAERQVPRSCSREISPFTKINGYFVLKWVIQTIPPYGGFCATDRIGLKLDGDPRPGALGTTNSTPI
jgi:hypothetical protein